jgi:hypothetical protein
MEAQSTFLERLSPEIRLSIYSHVFGTSSVIKPSSSDTALGMKKRQPRDTIYLSQKDTLVDSSILATSKCIYNEALPILYKDKIVRGTMHDLERLLDITDFTEHVRHIEIADCISSYQDDAFNSGLIRLQRLPAIRSLTILSDCLYFGDNGVHLTVSEFCKEANLGEATCVDVGRYQLHGNFSKYQFAHRRLVQMWPRVQSTPENYDPFEDLESMQRKWPSQDDMLNRIPWYLQTSLRCWVALLEEARKSEPAHDLETHNDPVNDLNLPDKTRAEIIAEFKKLLWLRRIHDMDLESAVEIRCLTPEHDHEVLLRVTEFLSTNITAYNSAYNENNDPERRPRRSHWPETDGCMPTIKYMLMHQGIAQAGLPDPHYFVNPVRSFVTDQIEKPSFFIHNYSEFYGGILHSTSWDEARREVYFLGALEKKQLSHLRIALTGFAPNSPPYDDEYVSDLEKWSADLLRRYIKASGRIRPLEVAALDNASLDELRSVVLATLSGLASEDKSHLLRLAPAMCTFAPEGFDDDLYEPFAWLYGALLADSCWKHFHPTTINQREPKAISRFVQRATLKVRKLRTRVRKSIRRARKGA